MAYRDIQKRRAWFRRRYRCRHEWELERSRTYRAANRRRIARRQRQWIRRKMASDRTYRLLIYCQISWKSRCRRAGVFHAEPFLELLGMPWERFTRYVERRFKPGMTWQNIGEWHLDHRLPVNAFSLRRHEERAMCCFYRNLAPMWAEENRKKNGSFSKTELRSFKLIWRSQYRRKLRQSEFFKEATRKKPIIEAPF